VSRQSKFKATRSDEIAGLPASLRSDGGRSKIHRLKSEVVMDMAFVWHYSVS